MNNSDWDILRKDLVKLDENSEIVVLTGAGVSEESGIKTFRDSGGLWEEHDIYEVATPEAWDRNPALVQRFYNDRRKQLLSCQPNDAHKYLVSLQDKFNVTVITQNIDDLHERSGQEKILHLHGELLKVRSTLDDSLIYDVDGWEITMDDRCEKGGLLRPHVVWFGEMVPEMEKAAEVVRGASLLLVVGTSLSVYPAAGLVYEIMPGTPVVLIDPDAAVGSSIRDVYHIKSKAGVGVKNLVLKMLETL